MQTLTSRSSTRRRWARFLGTGATALVAATTVGTVAGAATTPANAPAGASGSIAALQASSMEVQNPTTGQTTVSWTTTTQFSKTVTESVGSLAAGDCVTVTGTPSKTSKTTIAARSITVLAASSTGSCTTGAQGRTSTGGAFGGGGFNFRRGTTGGSGSSGTRPSFPAGGARRFPGLASIAIASGKVTGVSGSTISLTGIDLSPGSFTRSTKSSSSKSAKAKKPVAPKTENLKVTTSGSTTLTATQASAATDLAVGDCVTAFGPAATNGAVTASTVRITSTGGATCTSGFAGGGFFRGGSPGGPGGFGGGAPGGGSA
jgi:hypothetical protein